MPSDATSCLLTTYLAVLLLHSPSLVSSSIALPLPLSGIQLLKNVRMLCRCRCYCAHTERDMNDDQVCARESDADDARNLLVAFYHIPEIHALDATR
ncbi:hypothetical protein A0H81_04052 [Grifola frondosa]|uniref:Secreted protein n=1 Tax=Grifola frondosa TaxID=5627 RepID=A0A1C7MM24_GRIFR|nr:hypothetical protein A0H81_04052 [Grifola frondosa]